jgi:hypothetical protein
MTLQTSDSKHSGFLHSLGGQMIITIVVIAAVIALAWRYVF